MTLCPKKVFEVSDEVNRKGFNVITPARQEDCIRCRLCEKSCPDLAIVVDEE
jgi:NAD-dependent dihydropyrimidine dehydrogenase PreA subunit